MKIKEFSIIRYGPLPSTGRIFLGNFNLFFGKNEDGKTLTIDALVKLLLGRNIKGFEKIDRVEENPEGYLLIEDEEGEEIKLPERGNLLEISGLTSSECRNIFVIRDSDLSITRESEFYTNVTDRLTGLRTEEISKTKEALREIGKITPSGIFRDIKDERLKTRIEDAKDLLGEIEGLTKEVKEERFDELQEEWVRCSEQIGEVLQKIGDLENARKREKYKRGREALDRLKKSLERLKELEIYDEDDELLWRDCEREIQNYEVEKEKLFKDLKENEKKLKEITEKLVEKGKNFLVFVERKRKLDEEVRPKLKNYEIKMADMALKEVKNKFFTSIGITFAILLGISLIGIIVKPSLIFYILAVLFSISTGFSWIFKFQFVRERAWLARALEEIKITTSKFELDAENAHGILSNIQKFDDEYLEREKELREIEREHDLLRETIKDLKTRRIPAIEEKIKEAEKRINEIKGKSGVQTLQEYKERLNIKTDNEGEKNTQIGVLKSHFGSEGETLEAMIAHWEREIEALEAYENKAVGVIFDEGREQELKGKRRELEEEKDEIFEKMRGFQERLKEIEGKANKILRREDYLHCKTSVDLDAVRDELQEFINRNESNKDAVLKVIKIFEEIEIEEKERVSELFGGDNYISKYFNDITDGLYKEVSFNQGGGEIEVRRKDGVVLEAGKLSGGAYDQLYLSIRLALGEKILKGKKGFFIMDDPFIKADPDRLRKQIEILYRISEWGWQVLYFTAKEEIRDVLKKKIDSGAINYVEIQGIYF